MTVGEFVQIFNGDPVRYAASRVKREAEVGPTLSSSQSSHTLASNTGRHEGVG